MSSFKTAEEAYISLKNNFEEKIGDTTQTGSVIDIYNKTIADECADMYQYIEDSKNPYLFTNTFGKDLDSLGYWVNLPRAENEDDASYKFRLKDWLLTVECSNTTAITNSLLLPKYASNIQYVPFTHGSGTGTCYIIPKVYEEENISNALKEAEELLKDVVSPSLYIEYIVPTIRGVSFNCFISTTGEESLIKSNIEKKVKEYVNGIAPGEYLSIGEVIRMGINEPGVNYFNIISCSVDQENNTETEIMQELDTKFLFDEIYWSGKSK